MGREPVRIERSNRPGVRAKGFIVVLGTNRARGWARRYSIAINSGHWG